jgi:DNA polymerase-3 subunit alpha
MEAGQRSWRDRLSGQGGLFGGFDGDESPADKPLPKVPDWTPKEKLAGEKELLGFYVTGHPLDEYEEKIQDLASHDSAGLEGLEKGVEVALCGVLTGIQRRRNKEQRLWASMVIEDRVGSVEGLCFATAFERLASMVVEDKPMLVRGLVLPEEGAAPKISIQDLVPLEVARVPLPSLVSIRVWLGRDGTAKAEALRALFERKPGDTLVRLKLDAPRDFSVVLDVPQKIRPDRQFRAELIAICGDGALESLSM